MESDIEFKNDIHKLMNEKCKDCKHTDFHWCGYCMDANYIEYLKNNKEVFQFESSEMINKLKKNRLKGIDDLSIV